MFLSPYKYFLFLIIDVQKEQCCVIRYCVHRGLSANDTVKEMADIYKEECLSRATIFRWHKSFSEGCESAELLSHIDPPPPL